MNLDLLQSFGQSYPEELDGSLECSSVALACVFNRRGSLLGVGCNDGRVVIYDFVTRGIAKIITAHVYPVCSLSWSRNGKNLLSASTDNTVAMWDVLTGDCDFRVRYGSPVLRVQFHPRDCTRFIISPLKQHCLIVSVRDKFSRDEVPAEDDLGNDLNIVASFNRKGDRLFTGNGKGKITIFDSDSLAVIKSFRLPSNHAVKLISFCRKSDLFLTNSQDRIIRVYSEKKILNASTAKEFEPMQKLQDLVNKTPWKTCCFSGDGEFVCAGSAKQHALYMWERNTGSLLKILHGNKGEQLLDIAWHPVRPLICSVANGVVSVWAQTQVENWSAFAPDFKELDENVEYDERESEFDLEDEDKTPELSQETSNEDVEVDVTTVQPIHAFWSSDEEPDDEDSLWHLPVAPEIENYEDGSDHGTPDGTPANAPLLPPSLTTTNGGSGPHHKRQQERVFDIDIENKCTDTHPLLLEQQNLTKKRPLQQTETKILPKQRKSRSSDQSGRW